MRKQRICNDLTYEEVNAILAYDPATGVLTWKARTAVSVKIGQVAGTVGSDGYRRIGIKTNGKTIQYQAHRLAWLLATKAWPSFFIDHVNGNPSDNRSCNLREATREQNAFNSKCQSNNSLGVKGVEKISSGRYRAKIRFRGKVMHLGVFDTKEQASSAYTKKSEELFGEFACDGSR